MSSEKPKKKRKGLLKYLSMETIHESGKVVSSTSTVPFMITPSPRRSVQFWSTSSESMSALDGIGEDEDLDGDSGIFRQPSFSGSFSSYESKLYFTHNW